ncbi:MAG: competence/damage-inducible protein A [Verrucomicrobiota bacterium]|nr:competence/damage-inducible protein A [Verrucomicrobiota bacterium]
MNVVVINTGTELLLGSVLNTHLSFIARQLFPFGLRIAKQLTVPDGEAIRDTVAEYLDRADLVFITGGLGPTTDDITREVTAELLGRPLRRNEDVATKITARLRSRGFPMTDRILRQAEVPEGATILPNTNGTAPGLYLAASGNAPHFFLLPGPPRELEPMFRESVVPILRSLVSTTTKIECRTFRLTGIGESMVEAAVGKKILALGDIELGYCARPGEVDVRLLGESSLLNEAEALIREAFPKAIYTTEDEQLEEVVIRLLTASKQTVTTAESCTGGYLAHRLTNVPGASAVYLGGFVTYANELKIGELGVPESLIAEHGAVSRAVAGAMAEGAMKKANARHALATTGIAGPDGGTKEKPVGTVFIGLASADAEMEVQRFRFFTDRESFKRLTSQTALEMLRQRLLA